MRGQKHIFTDEQIKYIVDNWSKESIHSMKKKFNCSWYAIANVGKEYDLKMPESTKWTKDDINTLIEYAKKYDIPTIAKKMNRTENAIYLKTKRLNIPLYCHKRSWTKEDEEEFSDLWGTMSIEALANRLNRSVFSLKVKAIRMGLGSMIRNNTEVLTISDIVDILNVTRDNIMTWSRKGLKVKNKKVTDIYHYYYVEWEDLIEFLKNNQDLWDSSKVDLYMLGEEYDWLVEKRKRDIYNKPNLYKKWTDSQKNMAISYFKIGLSYEEIGQKINRSTGAVRDFLNANGFFISDRYKWSLEDEQYLKENLNNMTYKELAEYLNKNTKQIEYKVYKEGLKKVRTLKK